jgi:hypothetical protein
VPSARSSSIQVDWSNAFGAKLATIRSQGGSLRRFLSFIVEQQLSGQGHTLKESVLAVTCPSSKPIPRVWVGALALVVSVLTVVVAWRTLRKPADAPSQLLPLASYPGNEGPPALSPDGNLVTFAWSGLVEPGPTDTASPSFGTAGMLTISQLGGAERLV